MLEHISPPDFEIALQLRTVHAFQTLVRRGCGIPFSCSRIHVPGLAPFSSFSGKSVRRYDSTTDVGETRSVPDRSRRPAIRHDSFTFNRLFGSVVVVVNLVRCIPASRG
jgi:hypothetical protein